jgi:hypothetical protein
MKTRRSGPPEVQRALVFLESRVDHARLPDDSLTACDDFHMHLWVRFLPRSDSRSEDLAVTAFADAVQQVCLDLVGAVLYGQAP